MEFIMLVGLPGSGKTTYGQAISDAKDYILLSSDVVRERLYGDESIQGDSNEVFSELKKCVCDSLSNGYSVVYDATNIKAKHRRRILEAVSKYNCDKICNIIATPYQECLKNNRNRSRVVPDYVIERMWHSFEFPMYNEGFDKISIVYCASNKFSDYIISEKINALKDYNQNNSHHNQTLGWHLVGTAEQTKNHESNHPKLLFLAGLLHDIGKPYVRTETDIHGNPTSDSHYYNHHNVSSYEAMFYLKNFYTGYIFKDMTYDKMVEDIIYICQLISNHMRPYFWKEKKTENKYKRIWGNEFFDDVMILHDADLKSHE